ncbi:hypothetical protein [Methylobacterium gnaphalii]|uniref:Uncharacterized protein n=1 Tax=Methylobacterium gnaphalii TaxID=1010610 RepID=A0A512JSC6_9HYPH|nr:hypothetical protein [Methylobacterium gnaphalii]GEP12822.1 hypothetical protein MGN01_46670 [Methylobacterium gnaphalii]GJD71447.1 hypothetical protein MMMDOFMJ_4406 [Methylobacterium gnaphalii]GLS51817.1 hypothetical protein GCM10007885_46820 [Methylobacterium gnaphalii]
MAGRTSVRIDPISRDIALMLDEEMSPDAQQSFLAAAAQEALTEAQETNRQALGYVPEHETFIDGAKREVLTGLTPKSSVLFEFKLLTDIIEWVDEQLIIHSPVKRGAYARSHVWFADDVEFDPMKPPPAEQYMVLNEAPYARKIERGQSNQAPDGVYQGVATLAKRRFGNVAYVGFGYRSFPGGAVGKWAQSANAAALAKRVRGGNPRTHQDWLTRQPAIILDPGR